MEIDARWFQATPCPDCGAQPGAFHTEGCDVARCPLCGVQWISCMGECDPKTDPEAFRRPWSGVWPGVAECHDYKLRVGTAPDINQLYDRSRFRWDRSDQRFVSAIILD